jgi:hypothetical protein
MLASAVRPLTSAALNTAAVGTHGPGHVPSMHAT